MVSFVSDKKSLLPDLVQNEVSARTRNIHFYQIDKTVITLAFHFNFFTLIKSPVIHFDYPSTTTSCIIFPIQVSNATSKSSNTARFSKYVHHFNYHGAKLKNKSLECGLTFCYTYPCHFRCNLYYRYTDMTEVCSRMSHSRDSRPIPICTPPHPGMSRTTSQQEHAPTH